MRSGTAALAAVAAILLFHAGSAVAAGAPAASAAARIGESLPLGGVITSPDWVRKPSGEELADLFPPLGQYMQIEGSAVVSCAVTVSGELERCKVVSEAPLGIGFGDATLKAAKTFRMKPMTMDGAPVAGAAVTVPLTWRLSDDPAPPASPTTAEPAPSEVRLALARRVVALAKYDKVLQQTMESSLASVVRQQDEAGAVTHPAERQLAIESFREAVVAGGNRFADKIARRIAARLTDADLQQIVAFLSSPAGGAWTGIGDLMGEPADKRFPLEVFKDAGARFCKKIQCPAAAGRSVTSSP